MFVAIVAQMLGFFVAAAAGAVAPLPLAVREGWASFRDEAGARCWAVATPDADGRPRGDAAARVLVVPGERPRLVLRAARAASSGTLLVGDLRVALTAADGSLWTRAPADDDRALAAMRAASSMSLVARGTGGGTIRHRFALAGAATAIDVAILGCGSQNRRIDPR